MPPLFEHLDFGINMESRGERQEAFCSVTRSLSCSPISVCTVAIVGPNGVGKSTLLNILLGKLTLVPHPITPLSLLLITTYHILHFTSLHFTGLLLPVAPVIRSCILPVAPVIISCWWVISACFPVPPHVFLYLASCSHMLRLWLVSFPQDLGEVRKNHRLVSPHSLLSILNSSVCNLWHSQHVIIRSLSLTCLLVTITWPLSSSLVWSFWLSHYLSSLVLLVMWLSHDLLSRG